MSSLKTLYRAVVMVATATILFKGWQLYGPTTEQMKAGALRALEVAQETIDQVHSSTSADQPANVDPRIASPILAADSDPATPPSPTVESAALIEAPAPASSALGGPPNGVQSLGTEAPQLLSQTDDIPRTSTRETEKLPALMTRLEALGVAEPKLAPWGSTGKLYRFCCRAKLGDTTAFSKHFESVADEPAAAVEQVVAKVEAWRLAQNGRRELQ